jgi:hypothetical protein
MYLVDKAKKEIDANNNQHINVKSPPPKVLKEKYAIT